MRYYVTVAGRELALEVDGDRVTIDGRTFTAALAPVPGTPLRLLTIDGGTVAMVVEPAGRHTWQLGHHGEHFEAEVIDERTRYIRSLTGAAGRRAGPAALRAPMPGLVVRIPVEPGQQVAAGAGIAVLEAMKMENELKAAAAGVVQAVLVKPGQAVEKGQVLVEFAAP